MIIQEMLNLLNLSLSCKSMSNFNAKNINKTDLFKYKYFKFVNCAHLLQNERNN